MLNSLLPLTLIDLASPSNWIVDIGIYLFIGCLLDGNIKPDNELLKDVQIILKLNRKTCHCHQSIVGLFYFLIWVIIPQSRTLPSHFIDGNRTCRINLLLRF